MKGRGEIRAEEEKNQIAFAPRSADDGGARPSALVATRARAGETRASSRRRAREDRPSRDLNGGDGGGSRRARASRPAPSIPRGPAPERAQALARKRRASRDDGERARTLDSLARGLETETHGLVIAGASLAGRLVLNGLGEPDDETREEAGDGVRTRVELRQRSGKDDDASSSRVGNDARATRRREIVREDAPGVNAELLLVRLLSLLGRHDEHVRERRCKRPCARGRTRRKRQSSR